MGTRASVAAAIVLAVAVAAGAAPPPRAHLAGRHHPRWAIAANDLGAAPVQRLDHLTVVLARGPEQARAFGAYAVAQQTPGSPQFHRWLTPDEIGARFGASEADLRAITAWLRGQGFRILHVSRSRSFIEIAGTTAIAARAFGVQFHRYRVGGRALLAIDREPTLPASIAPHVLAITGLAEAIARPQHVARVSSAPRPDYVASDGEHFVSPSDFTTIYDLAPLYLNGVTGSGQTIGIIGRARVLDADVSTFDSAMGESIAQPAVIIPPTGTDPGAPCGTSDCATTPQTDDQVEATLDVQRAGSTAPGATVDLIISASSQTEDGVFIALEYAIDGFHSGVDANILSMSFGLCEDLEGQSTTLALDMLYQQAAMQGQSIFVSSGDSGAADCDLAFTAPPATQTLGMNALCASPAVTCVGGTELADSPPATYWNSAGGAIRYIPEGAWNEPIDSNNAMQVASTGGGISEFLGMPPYQLGLGPVGATGRMTPDVSFSASLHDGYFGCFQAAGGTCFVNGAPAPFVYFAGTSAAAPSMAAIMALVDQSAGANEGAANPRLYQLAAANSTTPVFHDVTVPSSGVASCSPATPSMCNNSTASPTSLTGGQMGFAVTDGYDEATGWGSIDAAALVAAWSGGSTVPSLKVDPASVTFAYGGSATVTLEPSNFLSPVTYACSQLPPDTQCSFSTTGANVPQLVLTNTAPVAAPVAGAPAPAGSGGSSGALLVLALGCIVVVVRARRPGRRAGALGLALAAACTLSCGHSANAPNDGSAAVTDAPSGSIDAPVDAPVDASAIDAPSSTHAQVTITATDQHGITASAMLDVTITP